MVRTDRRARAGRMCKKCRKQEATTDALGVHPEEPPSVCLRLLSPLFHKCGILSHHGAPHSILLTKLLLQCTLHSLFYGRCSILVYWISFPNLGSRGWFMKISRELISDLPGWPSLQVVLKNREWAAIGNRGNFMCLHSKHPEGQNYTQTLCDSHRVYTGWVCR